MFVICLYQKMKISLDQVFSERHVTDNSYVGWTMQLDCSAALQFLRHFYASWPELVVNIVYFRTPLTQSSIERRSNGGSFSVAWSAFPLLHADQGSTENVDFSG